MSALCYEIITLVIAVTTLILTWQFLGTAALPVRSTYVDITNVTSILPSTCTLAAMK